jgi:hypothetical protein
VLAAAEEEEEDEEEEVERPGTCTYTDKQGIHGWMQGPWCCWRRREDMRHGGNHTRARKGRSKGRYLNQSTSGDQERWKQE